MSLLPRRLAARRRWVLPTAPARGYVDHCTGPDLKRITPIVAGTGTAIVPGGASYWELTAAANNDATAVHLTQPIDLTVPGAYSVLINRVSGTWPTSAPVVWLWSGAAPPTPAALATVDAATRLMVAYRGTGLDVVNYNTSHVAQYWTGSAWSGSQGSAMTVAEADDHYEIAAEVLPGSGIRILIRHSTLTGTTWSGTQGGRWVALTDYVALTSLEAIQSLYLIVGWPVTNQTATGVVRLERFAVEPVTPEDVLFNGRQALAGAWVVYAGKRYGTISVPASRGTAIIPLGGSGAFDEKYTKDRTWLKDDDGTNVCVYLGARVSDTRGQVGVATGAGTVLTKFGSNPVLTNSLGTNLDSLGALWVIKDWGERDATKRYKLLVNASGVSGQRLFLATAPARTGPWTFYDNGAGAANSFLLGTGTAGTWRERGVSNSVAWWRKDHWEFWTSGQGLASGVHWGVGRFTTRGPNLTDPLVEDSRNPIIPWGAGPIMTLTADLNGRVATVDSTAGVVPDMLLTVKRGTSNDTDWCDARVLRVLSATSVELQGKIKGATVAAGAQMRAWNAGSVTVHAIREYAGRVEYWATVFGEYSSHPTASWQTNYTEKAMLYTAPDIFSIPQPDWLASPLVGHGSWSSQGSFENPSFLNLPTYR